MSLLKTSKSIVKPALTSCFLPAAPPLTRSIQHKASGVNISPTSLAGFGFIASNPLPPKPRLASGRCITEIRGPYYNATFGPRVLADTLAITEPWVDGLKFAGGGFSIMPAAAVRDMVDVAHKHGVYVSTGGFVERILATSNDRVRDVERYVKRCKDLGFDVIELSTGFLSLPVEDWAELVQCVQKIGLKAKPELGIQWGAGGDASIADLERAGTSDVGALVDAAKTFLDAGAEMLMIESEGITENVRTWRTSLYRFHDSQVMYALKLLPKTFSPVLFGISHSQSLCLKPQIPRFSNGTSRTTASMSTSLLITLRRSSLLVFEQEFGGRIKHLEGSSTLGRGRVNERRTSHR